MRVFINYKQQVQPDHRLARLVESALRNDGHSVFRDESNLIPSEEWPARLEHEIRDCNAMVSLVSNAALRSPWVLNEIDFAIKLEKRILPVVLEDIEDSLKFRAFQPRFMATQWVRACGQDDADLAMIASALREARHECYRGLIDAKLAQHAVADGRELWEALCAVLHQSHWPVDVCGEPTIVDRLPRRTGEASRSLAESLRNHSEMWAGIFAQNAANYHKNGDDVRSTRLTWQAQRLGCVASILDELLSAWGRNASRTAARLNDLPAESPIFDNSDGEKAFASEYAESVGAPGCPVPIGQVVMMHLPRRCKGSSSVSGAINLRHQHDTPAIDGSTT